MYDRKHQAAWDAKHIKTVSCRVTTEDHAALGGIAAAHKTTRYALCRALLLRTIETPDAAADFLGGGWTT